MKTKTLRVAIILVFLLVTLNLPVTAQQPASNTNEQIIENKVRINELEKKLEEQQEIITGINQSLIKNEENLKFQKNSLEYKNALVSWGLAILGILVTFFGVIIPIVILIFGKRYFVGEIKNQKEKVEKDINDFVTIITKELNELKNNAQKCIDNLKEYEKEGLEVYKNIKVLSPRTSISILPYLEEARNKGLTPEAKEEFLLKIKELKSIDGIKPYEFEMANALEFYYSDQYVEAIAKYLYVLRSFPNDISLIKSCDIYCQIGFLYALLSNYEKALEYYNLALNLMPISSDILYNIGCCYFFTNRFEKAIEHYQKANELNPNDYYTLNNLGNCYDHLNDSEKAIFYYKKSIDVNDHYLEGFLNIIETLLFVNRQAEAEEYLIKLKKIQDKDNYLTYLFDTLISLQKGKWESSIDETFEKLKTIDKNNPSVIDWSFNDIRDWIDSGKSTFLSDEQRTFIRGLIDKIEKWKS
jgi:tetratricopeptide (TPR) repeat protein